MSMANTLSVQKKKNELLEVSIVFTFKLILFAEQYLRWCFIKPLLKLTL